MGCEYLVEKLQIFANVFGGSLKAISKNVLHSAELNSILCWGAFAGWHIGTNALLDVLIWAPLSLSILLGRLGGHRGELLLTALHKLAERRLIICVKLFYFWERDGHGGSVHSLLKKALAFHRLNHCGFRLGAKMNWVNCVDKVVGSW